LETEFLQNITIGSQKKRPRNLLGSKYLPLNQIPIHKNKMILIKTIAYLTLENWPQLNEKVPYFMKNIEIVK